ncbi:hypothetical protein D3C84_1235230 [compost metagenome]
MYHLADFPWRCIKYAGKSSFRYQFRRVCSDHMYTDDIIRLPVSYHFNEAVLLSEHKRLSDGLKWNFSCLDIMSP